MEYSFSKNMDPDQSSPNQNPNNTIISLPTSQYFQEKSPNDVIRQKDKPSGSRGNQTKDFKNHKEILTKDLKSMMNKHLKQTKDIFTKQLQSYFNQLFQKVEKYILTADICSLIEVKYSNSDPYNLIPMIKYEFGSLLPQLTQSLAGFSQNLRQNVTLQTNGNGTFKYQRKTINFQPQMKSNYMQIDEIRNSASKYGINSKLNIPYGSASKKQHGFGQIQTSHFEPFMSPKKSYVDGTKQNYQRKRPNSYYNTQPFSDYSISHHNIGNLQMDVNREVQDTLIKMDVDKETRNKIQSVLSQQSNLLRRDLKQNSLKDYQYRSPRQSENLTNQQNGYVYQFTKTSTR